MKYLNFLKSSIKTIWIYFCKNLSQIVSVAALVVAIVSLNNANIQFKTNSNSADSLFKVQLINSKKLNDTLIAEIGRLQEITGKQLEITNEQLQISKDVLTDQINSGRPKVVIRSKEVSDKEKIIGNFFSPKITIVGSNIGERYANHLTFESFVVFDNFSKVRYSEKTSNSDKLGPDENIEVVMLNKFDLKFKDDFYFGFTYSYDDEFTNQDYSYTYYHHYHKIRQDFDFYSCTSIEEKKIKQCLVKNPRLKK